MEASRSSLPITLARTLRNFILPSMCHNVNRTLLVKIAAASTSFVGTSSLSDLKGTKDSGELRPSQKTFIDHRENVYSAAQRLGIAIPKALASLEKHATFGPPPRAVQYSEHPQVVAQRFGITNP